VQFRRVSLDWADFVAPTLAAVATGMLSSFVVWWFLTRRLRPRIRLCPTLATYIDLNGELRTQFRIRNAGRRAAEDIRVTVSLRMPDLVIVGTVEIALLATHEVAFLPPGVPRRWSIRCEKAKGLAIFMKYAPEELEELYKAGKRIALADVLAALDATVRIGVLATDSYSNTREYFQRIFSAEDIRVGRFVGRGCDHTDFLTWTPARGRSPTPRTGRIDSVDSAG
jgi:hypothetical protein